MIKIEKLDYTEIEQKGIKSWPIWEKEISEFDWLYDSEEECFILEGEIEVFFNGKSIKILPNDFVIFSKGLKCKWKIYKPVKKHYNFN